MNNKIQIIKEKIELAKDYLLEGDDRTFTNRITEKGLYIDGGYDFYKKIIKIIEEVENDI